MIEIATDKRWEKTKHPNTKDAKYGIYRYTTRFALPKMDAGRNLVGVNAYVADLIIRNASDGKSYLYDIESIKKDIQLSSDLSERMVRAAQYAAAKTDVSDNTIKQVTDNVNMQDRDNVGYHAGDLGKAEYLIQQKSFVDEMQNYLSTVMGEKGNEVSLVMYGVKLFNEKYYFPLKSATQFMAKAKEQAQGEVKIKNSGFSKETVQKANNLQ